MANMNPTAILLVRRDLPNDKTCTFPGPIQDDSPEILSCTDDVGDGTGTSHYMQPDAERNSQQLSPTDGNPRRTKSDLDPNTKPNCNDDYRY